MKNKRSPIQWLARKTTTRANKVMKKRPITTRTSEIMISCLADLLVINEQIGIQLFAALIAHGKKRKFIKNVNFTDEEREELLSGIEASFSPKVSSEK